MSRRLDNSRIAHPSARRVVCLASCLLSFLVLVMLPGCASSPSAKQSGTTNAPPWVDDAYAGTNRMVMLAAVGVAPGIGRAAEDAARRSAMRRVNEDILSSVRSELTTLSAQFASSDESTRWEQDMLEQIQIESEGDLPGAEVNDRWIDPSANATYVRVTVDRELLVRMLLDPVEESQLKAQGLLDGQQEASADAAQELLITLKAYALVAQTFTDALRANSAARSGSQSSRATPNVARAQQLYARSRTMLDQLAEQVARTAPRMQITVVQGDAQRGDPWERLDNALEGRVTLEIDGARQPMAQLPMRFRAQLPEGARAPTLVQSSATTNADGVIRCEVSELAAGQQGEGKIVLEVDTESLGPSLLPGTLPHATFVYNVTTAGQTGVAVDVAVQHDGRALQRPDLTTILAGHLSDAGFRASGRSDLEGVSPSKMADILGDKIRYAVVGEVTATYSSRNGGYYWYASRARLQIVHVPTGRVVQTLTREARKPWAERTEGGATAAVIALQQDLLQVLDQQFVSGFAP